MKNDWYFHATALRTIQNEVLWWINKSDLIIEEYLKGGGYKYTFYLDEDKKTDRLEITITTVDYLNSAWSKIKSMKRVEYNDWTDEVEDVENFLDELKQIQKEDYHYFVVYLENLISNAMNLEKEIRNLLKNEVKKNG